MMTLEEMKLAVCEKLPEFIYTEPKHTLTNKPTGEYWMRWKGCKETANNRHREINWPTEGLQVCHEAERLLGVDRFQYVEWLQYLTKSESWAYSATYEQRLEALCRVWFPERFV